MIRRTEELGIRVVFAWAAAESLALRRSVTANLAVLLGLLLELLYVLDTPTRTHDVVVRVHQCRFGRDRLGVAVGAALGIGVERELELGESVLDEAPLGGMGDSGGSRGDGHCADKEKDRGWELGVVACR